jgi:hypothetical protein
MGIRSVIPITDAGAAFTVVGSNQQTAFSKHRFWRMVKLLLLAALACVVLICPSSAQDDKVSVDMMGIGGMSCAHLAVYSSTSIGGNNLDL